MKPPRPCIGRQPCGLEVGDWTRRSIFTANLSVYLAGRSETAVFIDLGDQLQFSLQTQDADGRRHFGLVVDDQWRAPAWTPWGGIFRNFRDPWGNRVGVP